MVKTIRKKITILLIMSMLLQLFVGVAPVMAKDIPVAGFGKKLDLKTNKKIDIPYNDSTKLAGNSDFTVSMWIFPRAEAGCKTLYRQNTSEPGACGVWFRCEYDTSDKNAYLYFMFDKFNTGWQFAWPWGSIPANIIKFPLNQWTHVALTKEGSLVKTYVNGAENYKITLDPTRFGASSPTNAAISVGGDTAGNYFDGCIDEVRFWKTALSQEQISNWMYREIDITHPNYENLVYYYKMNQSNGIEVTDSIGTNHGTAVNISDGDWVDSDDIRDWTVNAGASLSGRLVGSDIDGASNNGSDWNLTFEITTGAQKGTVNITKENQFTYIADIDEEGRDSFQYRVRDSDSNYSDVQTVNINIIPTYDITYNLDGGTNGANPASYNVETPTITLENATKTGYTFAGWWDAPTAGTQVTQIVVGSTGNQTLYARWTANTDTAYKVEHYQQDVSGPGYTLKDTDNLSGTTATTATASAKVYPGFTENTGHESTVASGTIAPDGTLVLKLYYDRSTYTVSFNSNSGSAVSDITGVRYGATIPAPDNPAKTGYTFAGWYKEEGLTNTWTFGSDTVTAFTTLYAKWTANTHTVTFDANGGEAPSQASKSVTYAGTYGTLATVSRTGYTFNGWYTASSGGTKITDATTVDITANQTLYAQWEINQYITADITAAGVTGIVAPAAGAAPIAAGSLTAGNASYTVTGLTWQNSDGSPAALTAGGKFKAGSTYQAVIELTAAAGYKFQALTPTVDAGTAGAGTINTDAEGNRLTFTVNFDPTTAFEVTGIAVKTQPTRLTYTAGETLDLTELVVTLTYNDGTTADVVLADFGANSIAANPANGTVMVVATHNGQSITLTCNTHTVATNTLAVNPADTTADTTADITVAGVTGVAAPAAGAAPIAAGSLTAGNASYTVTSLTWQNSDGSPATLTAGGKFKAGSTYQAVIELTAAAGYKFQALTPTVDAGTAGAGTIDTDAEGNKLTFTVTFNATEAQLVTAIAVKTQPTKLTYTAGETLDLAGLEVTLTYDDGSTADIAYGQFGANGITANPDQGTTMEAETHNGQVIILTYNTYTATTGNLTVNATPTYAITLSETGTHTLTAQMVGYMPVAPITVTVTRIGTGNITNLAATLSGTDADDFTLGALDATTLDGTTTFATFTVKPNDALAPGTYTTTVTVTADNGLSQSFNISFTVNALSAPIIQSAAVGDTHVNITWSSVPGATGYKIYQSTVSGSYGETLATVNGSVYSYDATGLANGTTYFFVVRASIGAYDSVNSNEVSSIPQVPVPGAPVLQTAVAGDGYVNLT
ncbi:MAG: hypothetical protein GX295_12115 [Syntrophomonadaceae bacterium]|nr:hypothetical protein [Syntrophomonadaceae bacterium]